MQIGGRIVPWWGFVLATALTACGDAHEDGSDRRAPARSATASPMQQLPALVDTPPTTRVSTPPTTRVPAPPGRRIATGRDVKLVGATSDGFVVAEIDGSVLALSLDGRPDATMSGRRVGGVISVTVSAQLRGRAILLTSSEQYGFCPLDVWTSAHGRVTLGDVHCWSAFDTFVSDDDGEYVAFAAVGAHAPDTIDVRLASTRTGEAGATDLATALPNHGVRLAIAGSYVVASWEATSGQFQIASFAIPSGARTDVATSDQLGFDVDPLGRTVAFVRGGALTTAPTGGGAEASIASNVGSHLLTSDGAVIYTTAEGAIVRTEVDGTRPVTLASALAGRIDAISPDGRTALIDDGSLFAISAITPSALLDLGAFNCQVGGAAFTRDSTRVLACAPGSTLRDARVDGGGTVAFGHDAFAAPLEAVDAKIVFQHSLASASDGAQSFADIAVIDTNAATPTAKTIVRGARTTIALSAARDEVAFAWGTFGVDAEAGIYVTPIR